MAKKTLTDRIGKRGKPQHAHAHHGDDEADFDPLLTGELSRCNSLDFGDGEGGGGAIASSMVVQPGSGGLASGRASGTATGKDSGSVSLQERHMVPTDCVRVGMGRFAFLLETCAPGSVPDPLLISALLDLVSVVRRLILKGC